MDPIFTINSDDEIDDEEISEEEVDEAEEGEAETGFELSFNDGSAFVESYIASHSLKQEEPKARSKKKKSTSSEQDENSDIVRDMPHAEDRAVRALEKAKNRPPTENVGMDAETEASYFDSVVEDSSHIDGDISMFSELNLSRSLLRAVEYCGYVNPTPVQAKVIPFALAGRDICASALTGSGKTAAFVLPFLERLLFRPRDVSAIRVLVVTPTRELASQIYSVLLKLAQFTDVTCSIILGGKKDLRSQEAALRNRPDVVVCTPGRIIDHLRNTPSFTLDDLDVLVLDEVDRLLELGFQEELEEIVKYCPLARQTMLFSATMTSGVNDLAKLSLKRPVRIKTQGDATTVAPRLIQEFLRLRKDDDREAMLAALVCRNFNKRAIIFFETKREAHRFYVLCSLLDEDLSACELHGDMTQPQRELALQRFTRGDCEVMIATDVAARGLDISSVQTVINAEMPRTTSVYIHRVGRTARAGKMGRSITIVSDGRRRVMKDLLKSDVAAASVDGKKSQNVLSRTIPHAVIAHYTGKIASLEKKIVDFFHEENMKSRTEVAIREAERAENMLLHEDDIQSRPARTWYQTETQKQAIREASKAEVEASVKPQLSLSSQVDQMTMRDEYRDDEGDTAKGKDHRMSRKKRRRVQALAEVEEESAKTNSSIKKAKVGTREKEETHKQKTMAEMGAKRNDGEKVRRPVFAVGGLDQDMLDWNGGGGGGKTSKKAAERAARESKFTEFDPNKKLRKQGKFASNSFKSKSKFKRRK